MRTHVHHKSLVTEEAGEEARSVILNVDEHDDMALFRAMNWCGQNEMPENYQRLFSLLCARNIGLVDTVTRQVLKSSEGKDDRYDDLFSDLALIFMNAIRNFDPWRGFAFSTYACRCMFLMGLRFRKKRAKDTKFQVPSSLAGDVVQPEHEYAVGDGLDADEILRSCQLAEDEVTVIRECVMRGVGNKDLADKMGITRERVRQIRNSALEKLRKTVRGMR